MEETNNNALITKLIIGGAALFVGIIILLVFFPVVVIGAGERGVVFNNASGIENRILGEGVHFRIPLVENVTVMPIKTEALPFKENAGSSDSQTIDVEGTVNWHLDGSQVNTIYQKIGDIEAVQNRVLVNNVQDAIKASVSKFAALDFQRNRENVRQTALTLLQEKVKSYGIIVENLSFTNIQFSTDFNAAIEQAQVAQQKAKQAEYDIQRITNEAKSAIAKAQGEAEAQRVVQQSLTPELLQKLWIQKWNGVLPTTELGTTVPVFNLGK